MSAVVTPSRTRTDSALRSVREGTRECLHCGAPGGKDEFCCAGCAYVYRLMQAEGLQAYYKIKDKVTPPADTALLPRRDYDWLHIAQKEAEVLAKESTPELFLDVQGISCAGCVWLIEKLFYKLPGAGRVDVNAQTGQMRFTWMVGEFDAAGFAATLQTFNYLVAPASIERTAPPESRGLIKRIGLCAAFSMNVMLFTLPTYFGMEASFRYAALFGTLSLAFGTLSLLTGGGYFIGRAWRSLLAGAMNIDLPIGLGVAAAYSGSLYGWLSGNERYVYFDFVSAFILLMLTGRWAQVVAVERNQRRLLAHQPIPILVKIRQETGAWMDKGPETLIVDQTFEVASGQTVPVNSMLETTDAELNLAWINGETEPRLLRAGQMVAAGSINVTRAPIRLVAKQVWSESLLSELMRPAERVAFRNPFIERVIRGYLIGIIGVAFAAGMGWWWLTGSGLRAGAVVTAVLVVSCPCAIGLAFPLTDEIATVSLRRRGVFVRSLDLWSKVQRLRTIVFDKTGTLTFESPVLQNPEALAGLAADDRSRLFALVSNNAHPVALSLHDSLLAAGLGDSGIGLIDEVVGFGVKLESDGHRWTLGRPGWLRESDSSSPSELIAGETEFCRDGCVLARFNFMESARVDAKPEIEALQARGLRCLIASGDARTKVAALAAKLGLPAEHGLAEMTPEEKANWIVRNGAGDTLMLGDGANDSLAFDRALCRGTPVVHRGILEKKADFYYLGRGIGGVRALFETDDSRRRTHRWLLAFSIGYNLFAVALAVAGKMNPLIAAVLMPVSSLLTLVIVTWGMRGVWRQ